MKNGIRATYMVVAGAIAIGGLAYGIGVGTSKVHRSPEFQDIESRVRAVEKLCERWDERWLNLEKWMIRIETKVDDLNRSKE